MLHLPFTLLVETIRGSPPGPGASFPSAVAARGAIRMALTSPQSGALRYPSQFTYFPIVGSTSLREARGIVKPLTDSRTPPGEPQATAGAAKRRCTTRTALPKVAPRDLTRQQSRLGSKRRTASATGRAVHRADTVNSSSNRPRRPRVGNLPVTATDPPRAQPDRQRLECPPPKGSQPGGHLGGGISRLTTTTTDTERCG